MTVGELLEKIVYVLIDDDTRIVVVDEIGTHKVGSWVYDQITWYYEKEVESITFNKERNILVIDVKEN